MLAWVKSVKNIKTFSCLNCHPICSFEKLNVHILRRRECWKKCRRKLFSSSNLNLLHPSLSSILCAVGMLQKYAKDYFSRVIFQDMLNPVKVLNLQEFVFAEMILSCLVCKLDEIRGCSVKDKFSLLCFLFPHVVFSFAVCLNTIFYAPNATQNNNMRRKEISQLLRSIICVSKKFFDV